MPKTIADLTINWIFESRKYNIYYIADVIESFMDKNPDLINYRIKKGEYLFDFRGTEFSHYSCGQTLPDFFEDINYHLCGFLNENESVKLIGFELISENTFKIHGIMKSESYCAP